MENCCYKKKKKKKKKNDNEAKKNYAAEAEIKEVEKKETCEIL